MVLPMSRPVYFLGGSQTVQPVSKWPGQGVHKGYSKIPTLVYYDQDRKVLVPAL